MQYIPEYIASQPDKKFRKDPETFLNNEGWKDEIILSASQEPKLGRQSISDIEKNSQGW